MATLTLIGLKTCDTCRKAMRALEQAGHNVTFRDLRADPPEPAERAAWLDAFGDDLVNRRSTTWRGLDTAARAEPAQTLLQDHPALMKRPLIVAEGALYLGWTPETRAALASG